MTVKVTLNEVTLNGKTSSSQWADQEIPNSTVDEGIKIGSCADAVAKAFEMRLGGLQE